MKHLAISLIFFLVALICTVEATHLYQLHKTGIIYTPTGAETASWPNYSYLALALSVASAILLITNQKQLEKWLRK